MAWTRKEQIFEKDDGVCLKAIFALVIFVHHFIEIKISDPPSILYQKLGAVAVGTFFILSMYGLWKSYQKQGKGYARRIFLKKIPALWGVQVSINVLYYFWVECGRRPFTATTILRMLNLDIFLFQGEWRLNPNSWFMTTIILVYAFFGLSILIAELFKGKWRVFAFLVSFALMMTAYALYVALSPQEELYLRGIEALFAGLLLAVFEKPIIRWLTGWKYWLAFAVVAGLSVGCLFVPQEGFFGHEAYVALSINSFVCLLMMRCTFGKTPILHLVGELSLDFYLLQGGFFWKIHENAPTMPAPIFFVVTLVATLALSWLYFTLRAYAKGTMARLFTGRKRRLLGE